MRAECVLHVALFAEKPTFCRRDVVLWMRQTCIRFGWRILSIGRVCAEL